MSCKYFSLSVGRMFFHFVDVQMPFSLMYSHFLIFAFGVKYKEKVTAKTKVKELTLYIFT